MKTAGEGGAWGIAVLASYMKNKKDGQSLADYLNDEVFAGQEGVTEEPIASDVAGFDEFLKLYSYENCFISSDIRLETNNFFLYLQTKIM